MLGKFQSYCAYGCRLSHRVLQGPKLPASHMPAQVALPEVSGTVRVGLDNGTIG